MSKRNKSNGFKSMAVVLLAMASLRCAPAEDPKPVTDLASGRPVALTPETTQHEGFAMTPHEFVPYLSVTDAKEAVAFYSRVFDTPPTLRLDMPDGRVMHCEFRVGGARFFLSEELPEHGGTPSPGTLGATSVAIHVYVDDCDAMVATMAANGATILMDPIDMFWGERFARVRDPFGHEWGITTHLFDMTPAEIQASAAKMFEETPE